MTKNNNLYEFKTPKTRYEETGFFNIKGRITITVFSLRFMLALGIYGLSFLIYESEIYTSFGNRIEVLFDTFHTILLPLLLFIFVLIQGAKRMHDINISGWHFLIPLYNIYLVFCKGTKGNNNFGIDPNPVKNIQYFDELAAEKNSSNKTSSNNVINSAEKTLWKFIISLIAISFFLFLFWYNAFYLPSIKDWDGDGIPDSKDYCKFERGSIKANGCPDEDEDGIPNVDDKCPNEAGDNKDGCPY